MIRLKAAAAALVVLAALVVGGAAAARTPTASQKAAITAALRSEQGDVAIQRVLVSSVDPTFARVGWGFSNHGFSAEHDSLVGLTRGAWKVLWTRDAEAPADGACLYVPAAVARDLLSVSCPPAAKLHARVATKSELRLISIGFHHSKYTPYAKTSSGLTRVCVSRVNQAWAGGVAGFSTGASIYVFFHRTGRRWTPAYESLLQQGPLPPAVVLVSLASCVGYNPSDYNA